MCGVDFVDCINRQLHLDYTVVSCKHPDASSNDRLKLLKCSFLGVCVPQKAV